MTNDRRKLSVGVINKWIFMQLFSFNQRGKTDFLQKSPRIQLEIAVFTVTGFFIP
jgi:hypothetical protein